MSENIEAAYRRMTGRAMVESVPFESVKWVARHANGSVCTRATTSHDCPLNHDYTGK